MLIRFQHTELVEAAPDRLFAVLTDYANYPHTNSQVLKTVVKHQNARGAEVYAERRTPVARKVTFVDSYAAAPLRQFTRRYAGDNSSSSVWTVEPAFGGQSYFTILAEMRVAFFPGILLWPILRQMFYSLNFAPFIRAAMGSPVLAAVPVT
jgi:hypothetical protein